MSKRIVCLLKVMATLLDIVISPNVCMRIQLSPQGIFTAAKAVIDFHDLLEGGDQMWMKLKKDLKADDVCVKPVGDGCSTGVARLRWVVMPLSLCACRQCNCELAF